MDDKKIEQLQNFMKDVQFDKVILKQAINQGLSSNAESQLIPFDWKIKKDIGE